MVGEKSNKNMKDIRIEIWHPEISVPENHDYFFMTRIRCALRNGKDDLDKSILTALREIS